MFYYSIPRVSCRQLKPLALNFIKSFHRLTDTYILPLVGLWIDGELDNQREGIYCQVECLLYNLLHWIAQCVPFHWLICTRLQIASSVPSNGKWNCQSKLERYFFYWIEFVNRNHTITQVGLSCIETTKETMKYMLSSQFQWHV